ncbi:MAG: beta-ketoacyl-ACP synthase II [Bacteroidaceae bacterium]|nr:beta-ketoacyl-ACP synthase II [Bacteroidaceae bacterium]
MEKRVVITGMGVISPIGNSINEFHDNMFAGVCGIDRLQGFDDYNLTVSVAGQVKNFKATEHGLSAGDARRSDLYCHYGMAAAIQAMNDSGLVSGENIEPENLGVYVGTGIGGMKTFMEQCRVLENEGAGRISPLFIPMMIPNIAGGNIAIRFKAQGPALTTVAACATGTNAIGEAYRAIKHGYTQAAITGGAEAVVNPLAIGAFANSKALTLESDPKRACIPFDVNRKGFVMAEGAGIMILEELEHAKARGAKIYAEVVGYGNTCDAYHYTAPSPDGIPASRAIKMALDQAEYKAGENLYINAHGTSTHLNDTSETKAIKLAMGEEEARRASISSTKSMTGHMLGATGAVELIASVMALQDDMVPPTIGLVDQDPECDLDYTPLKARKRDLDIAISNSLGFGGHNACVALRKYKA